MKQYIDKDALVAEIKRRISEVEQIDKASYEVGLLDAYKIILSFINTLEVKEIDLEEEIDLYIENSLTGTNPIYTKGAVSNLIDKAAKYFFELGLKAKGEMI